MLGKPVSTYIKKKKKKSETSWLPRPSSSRERELTGQADTVQMEVRDPDERQGVSQNKRLLLVRKALLPHSSTSGCVSPLEIFQASDGSANWQQTPATSGPGWRRWVSSSTATMTHLWSQSCSTCQAKWCKSTGGFKSVQTCDAGGVQLVWLKVTR